MLVGRNEAKLRKAAAPSWCPARRLYADITNADDVARLVQRVQTEFKGLSVCVNNAG